MPERAGGYSYKDSSKYFTRNRFIYWRICHDILELVEHSLDINLANCRVRYKFTDTPILDGISIHETVNSVIILIVTVSSIHKLSFSHPDKIHRQVSMHKCCCLFSCKRYSNNKLSLFKENLLGTYTDLSVQSIFSEASVQNARDPHTFHIIANAGTTSKSAVAHNSKYSISS